MSTTPTIDQPTTPPEGKPRKPWYRRKLFIPAAGLATIIVAVATVGLTTGVASASTVNPYKSVTTHQRHVRDLRKVNVTIPSTRLPSLKVVQSASVRNTGSLTSGNWSGYADIACPTCSLRYVSADFTVPHLNTAKSLNNSWAAHWVGLDGATNSTVEQVGIDTYVANGQDYYYAWYEMAPAATQVYSLAASPGDNIQVSVYTVNGTYYLSLNDTTLGAGFNATATVPAGYTGQNKSAEVITEAPSEVSGSSLIQLPLADYGQVNFNSATVTSLKGTHGGLGSSSLWNGYAIKMVGASGATLSTPSGLLNGTNSSGIPVSDFTAAWQAAS
jgi:Peptidase A4 family